MGKVALIAVFSVAAISLSTYRLTGNAALAGIAAIVLVTLAVLGVIFYIVVRRPELAVMEGMELVQYQQITLGAKGISPPPIESAPNIAGPVGSAALDQKSEEQK